MSKEIKFKVSANNIKEEVNVLQKEIKIINDFIISNKEQLYIRELLNRIDSAIELINAYIEDDCSEFQYMNDPKELLNILKGNN